MGDADLARRWVCRSPEQADVADRVMRGAERAVGNKRILFAQQPADAVDLCCPDRLLKTHRGDDGRNSLCEHAFARSRRANEQHIVTKCAGKRLLSALGPSIAAA